MRNILVWLCLILAPAQIIFPQRASAQDVSSIQSDIQELMRIDRESQPEEFATVALRLGESGQPAADAAFQALRATDNGQEQLNLTSVLFVILTVADAESLLPPAEGASPETAKSLTVQPADVEHVIDLVGNASVPEVRYNAALICGQIGPPCAGGMASMFDLLRNAEKGRDQLALASSISRFGKGIQEQVFAEFRASEDPRYLASLARMMRNTDIPPDVQGKMVALLQNAQDTDVLKSVGKVVGGLEPRPAGATQALIHALRQSSGQVDTINAAYNLAKADRTSTAAVQALAEVLVDKAPLTPRRDILNVLASYGEIAVEPLQAARAKVDPELAAEIDGYLARMGKP